MDTATTGTGNLTLGSALSSYQTAANAGIANSDTFKYFIKDGSKWEKGLGTYTTTGTVLGRTAEESSIGGAAINVSGSGVEVYLGIFEPERAQFVRGLIELQPKPFTWTSNTVITLNGPGRAMVDGQVLTWSGDVTWTRTSETGHDNFNIYLFDSSGTPTLEAIAQGSDEPTWDDDLQYFKKGTDGTRRFLFHIKLNSSNNIVEANSKYENRVIEYRYDENNFISTEHRILSSGNATTWTSLNIDTIWPKGDCMLAALVQQIISNTTSEATITAEYIFGPVRTVVVHTTGPNITRLYVNGSTSGLFTHPLWAEIFTDEAHYLVNSVNVNYSIDVLGIRFRI